MKSRCVRASGPASGPASLPSRREAPAGSAGGKRQSNPCRPFAAFFFLACAEGSLNLPAALPCAGLRCVGWPCACCLRWMAAWTGWRAEDGRGPTGREHGH
ncbi:hypothetical protein BC831DRAFT_471125 [Entophlyctis helioformis]|nr:hypothetical protein BC831DRAFT_471125 [Entophlyctis helioformis]